jgi:fumarate hydratase class II
MHIACVLELEQRLLPSMGALAVAIEAKAQEWMDVPKTGQTHLQDATPLTVGQEWSGYATQLRDAIERVRGSEGGLFELGLAAPRSARDSTPRRTSVKRLPPRSPS